MSKGTNQDRSDDPAGRRFSEAFGLPGQLLRQHPGLLISLAYFTVSLIGMMFSWALFREFGVNVFDYAEITDFLMAALREPMTFLLAAGGIVVSYAFWLWTRLEQRYFARRPPRWWLSRGYARFSRWSLHSPTLFIVIVVLYSLVFIMVYAEWKAEKIRAGGGNRVLLRLADEADPAHRVLLGTTGKLIVVLDETHWTVQVIPYESVTSIEMPTPED